jgi:hypothetical protein
VNHERKVGEGQFILFHRFLGFGPKEEELYSPFLFAVLSHTNAKL